ncbi:MAG: AAA family ATPase [Gemmatimonas sp.]
MIETPARPLAAVTLRLCGDPAVLAETGARLPVGRKALALLAYLSMEPGPHSRQRLAALLWSDVDESHASMSLRQALARLRELLGNTLHSDRQRVWLEQDAEARWHCDADAFLHAADRDPLEATIVNVGAFLQPTPVEDAPEFSHWADCTRATLMRQAITSLRRCARDAVARRDWSRALLAAERWLALDPMAEEAAPIGMEAAFLRHDAERGRAFIREFKSAAQDDELAAEALDRMGALHRRLESAAALTPVHGSAVIPSRSVPGRAATTAHAAHGRVMSTPTLTPVFSASLQERDEVWDAASIAWSRLERGESATLLVESVSGGGRSRVLTDVTSWAVSRGAMALSAPSPGSPLNLEYTIIVSLLRGALDAPALAGMSEELLFTLSRLLPDVMGRFPAIRRLRVPRADAATSEPSFVWRLHEAIGTLFTLLCEDAPLVVAIDDAVWCDRESSTLLQQLMARTAPLPVLWILSAPSDIRADRPHQLWHRTSSPTASPTLPLPPLSSAAIARMMTEWSGIDDGWHRFAARVHAVSSGIPSHVVATIEEALERCDGDPAALAAAVPTIPKPHRRLGARVDALAELDRELLLSLALAAETDPQDTSSESSERYVVSVDALSHVHGISRLRAARVGGMLVDARLAEELPHGFRCASPSISAYTVASCSRLVADELRRRLKRWHPVA